MCVCVSRVSVCLCVVCIRVCLCIVSDNSCVSVCAKEVMILLDDSPATSTR